MPFNLVVYFYHIHYEQITQNSENTTTLWTTLIIKEIIYKRIFLFPRDNFILVAEIQIHIYWYVCNVLFNKYTLKTKLKKKLEEINPQNMVQEGQMSVVI